MQNPLPKHSYMDDRLISREYYNANPFDITFLLQTEQAEYIQVSGKPIGPLEIICKPDCFVILPHAFYTASWPDGRLADEVIAHFNFDREMYKGIKPNRETLRKARKHVNG